MYLMNALSIINNNAVEFYVWCVCVLSAALYICVLAAKMDCIHNNIVILLRGLRIGKDGCQ